MDPLEARVMAVSALAHIAWMVNRLARHGQCDETMLAWLLERLFSTHAAPEQWHHALCLRTLKRQLRGEYEEDAKAIMHYMMSLLSLEKILGRHPQMLQRIADRLRQIANGKAFFGDAVTSNTLAGVAALYGETISTLQPRIIVHGKPEYLNRQETTDRVRTLLLVGIRAAHQWHRHGGNHFRFILDRNRMLKTIDRLQCRPVTGDAN